MIQRPHSHHRRAFSLLELSVVLAIIGLIAGLGISLGGNLMSGSDRIATQQRLITIRTTLESYAQKNGYLPCPASRADIPTDANFGVERRDVAGSPCTKFAGDTDMILVPAAAADKVYIGALPTATLGLPASYAADAWGNKFLYAVSANHIAGTGSYSGMLTGTAQSGAAGSIMLAANASVPSASSTIDDLYKGLKIAILAGPGVGQSATITGYSANTKTASFTTSLSPGAGSTYMIAGGNTGTITIRYGDRTTYYPVTTDLKGNPGAAATYAVVSHGPNGRGGYPLNAKLVGTACADNATIDFENCDDTNAIFYDTAYNDGNQLANVFDDYIIWGTNAPTRAPLPTTSAGFGSDCPPGVCEGWCARCKNAPIYSAPTIIYACRSTILSNIPCEAQCDYAYFGAAAMIPCQ